MTISTRMQEEMNGQLNFELYSAYLYLSVAAYFHSKGLDGMAQWMRVQTQEELTHVMKFFDHINSRGGVVILRAIHQPKTEWDSPLAAFENAYEHEQLVTSRINELVKVAEEESDRGAGVMLQWFVTEQVEEEATTSKVAQALRLIGDSGNGLLMSDRELGARTFVMPAPTEQEGA